MTLTFGFVNSREAALRELNCNLTTAIRCGLRDLYGTLEFCSQECSLPRFRDVSTTVDMTEQGLDPHDFATLRSG